MVSENEHRQKIHSVLNAMFDAILNLSTAIINIDDLERRKETNDAIITSLKQINERLQSLHEK
jgi:gas vesicle protein